MTTYRGASRNHPSVRLRRAAPVAWRAFNITVLAGAAALLVRLSMGV